MKGEKIKKLVLDLLFPVYCLGCSKEGVWLCQDCYSALSHKPEQNCFSCGKANLSGDFCSLCKNNYYLDGITIAGNYNDKILSSLIKTLKYYFVIDLADYLGDFGYKYLYRINQSQDTKIIKRNTLFIPVPLSQKRLKWREFNQSELIAKNIARKFNLPLDNNLKKIKNNKPQTQLKKEKRLKNVKNCFIWKGESLQGKNIILIDDVITTGSTLNECAQVLKKQNAKTVRGFVLAHG